MYLVCLIVYSFPGLAYLLSLAGYLIGRSPASGIVCLHSSSDLTRLLEIRESRFTVFRNINMIKFIITNTKVSLFIRLFRRNLL